MNAVLRLYIECIGKFLGVLSVSSKNESRWKHENAISNILGSDPRGKIVRLVD